MERVSGARVDASARYQVEDPHLRIAPDDVPVMRVVALLWSGRWRILAAMVAGALLGFALTLVLPKKYTASASFTAESAGGLNLGGGLGGLAGMAGQLGVNLPIGSSSLPPDYFVALMHSRTVRDSILAMRVDAEGRQVEAGGQPLLEVLPIRADEPRLRRERADKVLDRMIGADVDRRANIVNIHVTDREPMRSATIANRTLALLNWHNVSQRQSRSRQQREFAQRRLEEVQGELRAAESAVQGFLARNRLYRGSPTLETEYARLLRRVQQKEAVVTTLTQSFETSRINEAGDLPVLSIIDVARVPVRRSSPRPTVYVPLGALLGLLAGLVLVVWRSARGPWCESMRQASLG